MSEVSSNQSLNKICYLGHKNALKNYLTLEDNIALMELDTHKNLMQYVDILNLHAQEEKLSSLN